MVRITLAIVAFVLSVDADATISTIINGIERSGRTHEILQGEQLILRSSVPTDWHLIQPEQREYDGLKGPAAVVYQPIDLCEDQTEIILDTLHPGTWLISPSSYTGPSNDIMKEVDGIVQIVVRPGNEYCDFLLELSGVPFTLPPRRIGRGHQTDLRLGTDCAELAIYGRRRMGFDLPYCGPRGIDRYCKEVEDFDLRKGDLIHFGDQVSVLYKDNGIRGALDEDDLLLHARPNGVCIETFRESEYSAREHYRMLRFNPSGL